MMMRSITFKLILAFIAISVISTALVVVFTRWRSSEEFRSFMIDQNRPSMVTAFSDYYQQHGSWQGISSADLAPQPLPPAPAPRSADAGPFTLLDTNGQIVLAGAGYQLGQNLSPTDLAGGVPIEVNNQTVGTLLVNRTAFRINPSGSNYLNRINLQVLWGGLLASAIALVLAVILSRTLTRPIRELTAATQVASPGSLPQEVPVRSRDELGQLATSFNRMNSDLARSINLRRQMTADIAHELRTPISIILGHAEAVHDGVLPPSAETFEIVREEAERLEHLVEDLRTLSMADAGELKLVMRAYPPERLIEDAQKIYAHQARQKRIALRVKVGQALPLVEVDPERMKQVFGNIIDNALRYTPENGNITLSAQQVEKGLELSVQDSGPGVAQEDLDRIFERFFRTEVSRSRDDGGSGLGFAIAKSIVEKHNGRIWAEDTPGGGLTVIIRLPTPQAQ